EGRAPGEDWSERTAGTNGAGLALAVGEPVAMVGAEHFVERLHGRTSTAAPIRLGTSIVGAIDIVTVRSDGQGTRLLLAEHIALVIGREVSQRPNRAPALGPLSDLVPVFIASCHRQRRFNFVNRGYAERFGLKPEDFAGKLIAEMVGEEAYASFAKHIDLVLAGQTVEFEVEVPY